MKKAGNFFGRFLLSIFVVATFSYGFYGTFSYVIPMAQGDLRHARTSAVKDQSEILINGAQKAYEEGNLKEATKVLELALEELVDMSGRYDIANQSKLEDVHFLLGKCYHLQEKYDKAIEGYVETLRLNPDHLPAKYNLEMIVSQGGGGEGGKQPDKGKLQPKI